MVAFSWKNHFQRAIGWHCTSPWKSWALGLTPPKMENITEVQTCTNEDKLHLFFGQWFPHCHLFVGHFSENMYQTHAPFQRQVHRKITGERPKRSNARSYFNKDAAWASLILSCMIHPVEVLNFWWLTNKSYYAWHSYTVIKHAASVFCDLIWHCVNERNVSHMFWNVDVVSISQVWYFLREFPREFVSICGNKVETRLHGVYRKVSTPSVHPAKDKRVLCTLWTCFKTL